METINQQVFLLLNASESPSTIAVAVARGIATWSVLLTFVLAAALWIWGRPSRRGALLVGGVAVLLGLSINFIISLAWFHPRPLMVGLGHQFLPHAAETSFPSDHATFVFSFGFALLLARDWRGVGFVVVMLGFLTAWARIYLGVHFPIDIIGSLVVAFVGAAGATAARPFTETSALPRLEALYERILHLLRLPGTIFPRRLDPASVPSPQPSDVRGQAGPPL